MGRAAKGTSLFLGAVVSLYLVLTWFFFGTPHPCGISVALVRYEKSRRTIEDRAETEKKVERLRLELLEIYEAMNRTAKMAAKAEIEGRTKDKMALLEAMFKLTEKRAAIEALTEFMSDPIKGLEAHVKQLSPAQCISSAIGGIKRIWFSGHRQNVN